MTDLPTVTAWDHQQDLVDETKFTPWAPEGWMSWNGQSPEVEVCGFAARLVEMMQPRVVVETGVGQGYMTRALATVLEPPQQLISYESNAAWRETMWGLPFWQQNRFFVHIAPDDTPTYDVLAAADLCVFDSDFDVRLNEIVAWDYWAKPGSVCLIHDTADREGTVHQTIRDLIQDLGMTGVFLQNPRGCFMAVQPTKEKNDGDEME